MLDPYFSGTKVAWLLTEGGVPAGPDLALGTIDTWVLWNLTGGAVHATDPSNASRTMLFDIRALAWSDELADLFGVPVERAARGAPVERSPRRHRRRAAACPAGIPVSSGIAGDQQAALFGQACFEPGHGEEHLRHRVSFVLMNVGPVPAAGRRRPAHDGGLDSWPTAPSPTRSRARSS